MKENSKLSAREKKIRRRQRITAVIAIILIAMMVVGLAVAAVYADATDSAITGESVAAVSASGDAAETGSSAALSAGETNGTSENLTASSGSSDAGTYDRKFGVYVDDIDVTGMTLKQIQDAIDKRMIEIGQDTITLYAGSRSVNVTAASLGVTYTNRLVAQEAVSVGNQGNIFKRFLADRKLSTDGPIVLCLDLAADEASVRSTLEQYMGNLNCEPKSNGLILNDDYTFTLTDGTDGVSVNEDASVAKIMAYISSEWHGGDGGVALDADITPYDDTTEDLSTITDLLGTATTEYDTSDEDHATNIELATAHINGHVVYPGEEFSTDDAIGPTTEACGFRPGASYSGSQIVETFGGGICQVSSTLYDAVLGAELEVTERHNHSHKIAYVDPGFDASITNDTSTIWDFKFVNNTKEPIYIEGKAADGVVTFNIYGQEYRPSNRKVTYVSEQSDPEDIETKFIESSAYSLGYIAMSGGIPGISANLYKVVTVDGEEESRDLVSTSVYVMMPLTYTVGIGNATQSTIASISAAIQGGRLSDVQSAVYNGSVTDS